MKKYSFSNVYFEKSLQLIPNENEKREFPLWEHLHIKIHFSIRCSFFIVTYCSCQLIVINESMCCVCVAFKPRLIFLIWLLIVYCSKFVSITTYIILTLHVLYFYTCEWIFTLSYFIYVKHCCILRQTTFQLTTCRKTTNTKYRLCFK